MPSSSLSVLSIPSSRWRLKWGRRVAVTTAAAFVTLFLVLNVWNVLYQVSSRDLDDCELVLRGVILPSTSTFTSKSTLILDSNPNVEGDDTDADADADADPLFIADPHHNAFAACLMIADDNQRLGEWLPYQYFAMPLRHLVVLVDGASTVSPTRILDKWRPYMTIEEWNEGHLNRTDVLTDRAEPQYKNLVRKKRQGYFYRKCATHLKALNYTWTSFIDTDEYPVLNDDHVPLAAQLMSTPGVILKTIQDVQQKIKAKTIDSHEQYAGPCVVTYRQEYGHVESTASEIARDVPTAVVDNPLRFDTLRYRHRARLLIEPIFIIGVTWGRTEYFPRVPIRGPVQDTGCGSITTWEVGNRTMHDKMTPGCDPGNNGNTRETFRWAWTIPFDLGSGPLSVTWGWNGPGTCWRMPGTLILAKIGLDSQKVSDFVEGRLALTG
eukprot:scaffold2640_cov180-Amphora_coffeaeformis.AAC.7